MDDIFGCKWAGCVVTVVVFIICSRGLLLLTGREQVVFGGSSAKGVEGLVVVIRLPTSQSRVQVCETSAPHCLFQSPNSTALSLNFSPFLLSSSSSSSSAVCGS